MFKDAVVIVVVIVVATAVIAVPIGIVHWVMGPLEKAARRNPPSPVQFTMVDFLILMAQLQVPLALCAAISAHDGDAALMMLGALGCLGTAALWWWGVSTSCRAGIYDRKRRALLVGVVAPLTVTCAIGFDALLASWTELLTQTRPEESGLFALLLFILTVAFVASLVACRAASRWIMAEILPGNPPLAPPSNPRGCGPRT